MSCTRQLSAGLIRNTRTMSTKIQMKRCLATAPAKYDWNEHQKLIPRLPLPKLEETMARYIEAVAPLGTPEQVSKTRQLADDFVKGDGAKLQAILEQRNKEGEGQYMLGTASSFVMPFWNKMYLGGRYPLPINSNPIILIHDLPEKKSLGQVGVAAKLTLGMLRWYKAYKNNLLEPDFGDAKKTDPRCMEEYEFLFGENRVPAQDADVLVVAQDSKHIGVIHGTELYKVTVIDDNGRVATEQSILEQFHAILSTELKTGDYIGALCSQERNLWAGQRSKLMSHPTNAKSFKAIDDSLFLVSLDADDVENDFSKMISWGLSGNGTTARWWDKNFTLVVDSSGTSGINFEHAPYDGMTLVRLIEESWSDAANVAAIPMIEPESASATQELLSFNFDAEATEMIKLANDKFKSFANNTKVVGIDFNQFGKSQIKKWKVSPDGYIQMAYQLAHKRLHARSDISVYESCSTKRFLRGRTEAIRPATTVSRAFADNFDDLVNKGDLLGARKLLDVAAGGHRNVAMAASTGVGVDRHLFSILSLAGELGFGADAPFFSDEMWTHLNTTILSTSNINGNAIRVLAFGAVCPQGYGLGYTVKNDNIQIAVSNFTGPPDTGGSGFGGVSYEAAEFVATTNATDMANGIIQALVDMSKVGEIVVPQAKL
eukprot:m.104204 g.104204  ORF g.104204 m.104204 type:complete len:658 (-) comp27556_c0_seq1:244-2217(-)